MGVSAAFGTRLGGRTEEREQAGRALRACGGVLFAGRQGVGKSALATTAARDYAGEAGAQVLPLHAAPTDTPVPFRAFAPLATDLGTKPLRHADYLTLLQALRGAIARRSHERPVVLLADDAHLLDGPSADLLLQLVAEGVVRTVLTVDPAMPAPGAIHLLWKDQLVERIEVEPLDHDSTTDLVADLLGHELEIASSPTISGLSRRRPGPSPGGDVSDAVWRMSRGFPLYARELVKEGCRTGTIALTDGVWHLDGELRPGPRLSALMAEKLDRLTAAQRGALELIAVAEWIPLSALQRTVRSWHLEALERDGLVSSDPIGADRIIRATHPVIAAVVRASLPVARAAAVARRLVEALEEDGRAESELIRIASWRLDAGMDTSADLLLRAGILASERQDWSTAARLAEAAVSRGAGAEATLVLADAHRARRRFSEAMDVLGDEHFCDDDAYTARRAVVRASVLAFGFGRLHDAMDVLARAEARVPDRSDQAWLRAMSAGLTGVAGRPGRAVEMAEELLAEPGLRPVASLTARAVLSIGLSCVGRTRRALEILDGIAAATGGTVAATGGTVTATGGTVAATGGTVTATGGGTTTAMSDLPTWDLTARLLAHQFNGDLDSLESAARGSYEQGLELHDPRLLGPAAAALGWVAVERGRLARAVAWFREAVATLRASGALGLRTPALIGLAEALALAGDLEGSRSALEEARSASGRGALLMPAWLTAAAWHAAAQGAVSEAFERLEEASARARADGYTVAEMRALHSAVRLGSPAPAARLAEMAGLVDGSLVQIVAAHAAALGQTDRLGESLDAVAERYAELGLNLYAAEASAQASRAHDTTGRPRKASASAARGHVLLGLAQDGDASPLSLNFALSPPALTRREREVAMLAAGGMPSQAIASRLCLSVRTVETHLARVYAKLGIGGRSELPAMLASTTNRSDHLEAG